MSVKMRAFVRGLSVVCALAMISGPAATGMAQQVPVRVIQGTDGTLYVVQDSNSWTLVPDQAKDSDVAALNPSGEIDGAFPNQLFVVQRPAGPPPVPVRVIENGDGTLYTVQGNNSWTLVPGEASDSDVAALNPGGEIDGSFPPELFVVQAPVVASPPAAPGSSATAPAPPTVAGSPGGTCRLVPAGLVGCWPGDGTAQDIVGGNDGILEGGAGFVPGVAGQAFSFNGKSQFVRIPMGASLVPGGAVSIVFWMRADPSNPLNACCQGFVNTYTYDMELSASRGPVGINFAVAGADGVFRHTSDTEGSGFVVPAGEWHHVVGTYDGSAIRLFVDGALKATTEYSGKILPARSGDYWAIGSEDGRSGCPQACVGTRYFNGAIDEVSIYNRAINEQEVAKLFKGTP